jgi:hydroxymethylpyrimidine kinase/phosphomethylpyrimidine kinase
LKAIEMSEVVLTIGGSDSGGGAGIQADIKTFSILGWHGTSALTAVTAQNTVGVQRVFALEPEAVAEQLKSISDDFQVAFAKTGMLFSAPVVSVVAEHLRRSRIPLVLDPVIEAEAGGRLLEPMAVVALKEELIPLAEVIVPNIFEARRLTGRDVMDLNSAELAAREILDMGARAVIVKGGHLDCIDLLLAAGEVHLLEGQRVMGGNHGVGCTYSAALTCFLAGGCSLKEAARKAKGFAAQAISWSQEVGRGVHPVNQPGAVLDRAERFAAMDEVQEAADMLVNEPTMERLFAEKGSNIGMAIPSASTPQDVAAVEGGLGRRGGARPGCVRFGADSRLARGLLAAMSYSPQARAAVILSKEALPHCRSLGSAAASIHDGASEELTAPRGGASPLPRAFLDPGDGEAGPLVWLLGSSALDLARIALELARMAAK